MAKEIAKDKKITKTTTDDKGREFANPALPIEGTKKQEEQKKQVLPVREIVRGEDVLKIMRAKGVKI